MKELLKFSLLIVSLTFFAVSCSDDDDDDDDFAIEFSGLPMTAKDLVTNYFGGESQVTFTKERYVAESDGTYYTVYLTGGREIDFDKSGNWIEIEGGKTAISDSFFDKDDSLKAIKKYVKDEYSTLSIIDIEKTLSGYKIDLSNDLDLLFDKSGNFLSIDK